MLILSLVLDVFISVGLYLLYREYKRVKTLVQDIGVDLSIYDQLKSLKKKQGKTIPQNKVGIWKK